MFSVESDSLQAKTLRQTVEMNDLRHRVTVVEGDIMDIEDLPTPDVVIAELIETGLLDEMQVAALNHLWGSGVICDETAILPGGYQGFVELVHTNEDFYGFKIAAPRHDSQASSKRLTQSQRRTALRLEEPGECAEAI